MKGIKDIVQGIKSKGFNFIKIELEHHLTGCDSDIECSSCNGEGDSECNNCNGNGTIENDCSNCDGTGTITLEDEKGKEYETDCENCNGSGTYEDDCEDCEGTGRYNCEDCNGAGHYDNDGEEPDLGEVQYRAINKLKDRYERKLKYSDFYNDGSVNTEWTFTLAIEDATFLPKYIEAFNYACKTMSQHRTTQNSGVHISLLRQSSYPSSSRLPEIRIKNFKKQVSKLIYALIYLGSPGTITRSFQFRQPKVSSNDKYSAIYTHGDTCIEYRLFDTCYNEPETVFRYLRVIENTLKYYSLKRKIKKLLNNSWMSSRMLSMRHNRTKVKLNEVFTNSRAIARLKKELKYLIPEKKYLEILHDKKKLLLLPANMEGYRSHAEWHYEGNEINTEEALIQQRAYTDMARAQQLREEDMRQRQATRRLVEDNDLRF